MEEIFPHPEHGGIVGSFITHSMEEQEEVSFLTVHGGFS
jgi:hypothetical protein